MGIPAPTAISWPGVIPNDQVRGQFAVNADWMPTLAELCNINLDTKELDGKSLMPVIENNSAISQHNEIFSWQHGKQWATRSGKWKLLGNPVDKSYKAPLTEKDKLFLVNLELDPGERNNLAAKHPNKVKELENQYTKWLIDNKTN